MVICDLQRKALGLTRFVGNELGTAIGVHEDRVKQSRQARACRIIWRLEYLAKFRFAGYRAALFYFKAAEASDDFAWLRSRWHPSIRLVCF